MGDIPKKKVPQKSTAFTKNLIIVRSIPPFRCTSEIGVWKGK
jgi:hypothetical protein